MNNQKIIVKQKLGVFHFATLSHGKMDFTKEKQVHEFMKRNNIHNYEIHYEKKQFKYEL